MTKAAVTSNLVAVVLLAIGVIAEAQQPKKVPRIGFLFNTSPADLASRIDVFRRGLQELGYVEGKTILFEFRFAEGIFDRLPDLAAELARISHNGIISRVASPENTFTSMIRGDPALLPWREAGNWTPIAAIRLCMSSSRD